MGARHGALFWWAPIWSVPHGSTVELSEHGWQLLAGNSFFYAMVVFMVGITVMLTVRRRRDDPVTPVLGESAGGEAVRPDSRRNPPPARSGHRSGRSGSTSPVSALCRIRTVPHQYCAAQSAYQDCAVSGLCRIRTVPYQDCAVPGPELGR